MKIAYIERNFSAASQSIIDQANDVIEEYLAQGFKLTLRQLYYQFVARGWLPNKQCEYSRLGSIINDGRLAGEIPWDAIEDRGRNLQAIASWKSPESIIDSCAKQFRFDLWEGQEYRPEVWIEKEALVGVIADVCDELRVPYFACKGYTSQSEMWNAGAQRMTGHLRNLQEPVIIYLGDHDPSGIDMTRDVFDRLSLFADHRIKVVRVALNMDQVEKYKPPPNPAKVTDSRFTGYVDQFGEDCWELDALNPQTLAEVVRFEVTRHRVDHDWLKLKREEKQACTMLKQVAKRFDDVKNFLKSRKR